MLHAALSLSCVQIGLASAPRCARASILKPFLTDSLNKLGMQPVIDFMKNVSLPILPSFLNMTQRHDFDWITSMVKIKRKIATDVFIGFTILTDMKNTTIKRLIFQEPSAGELFPGCVELVNMKFKIMFIYISGIKNSKRYSKM
jgi:hypothetical protein